MTDLMTRKEIARHFDVSERTIQRWEKKGMPFIKIAQVRRYDLYQVNRWLDEL